MLIIITTMRSVTITLKYATTTTFIVTIATSDNEDNTKDHRRKREISKKTKPRKENGMERSEAPSTGSRTWPSTLLL